MDEIETIYYQMWSNHEQRIWEEKHSFNIIANYQADKYLYATNIEENNKRFLLELKENIILGHKHIDRWLNELLVSYAKKVSDKYNTGYLLKYYVGWIDNTLCIIQGKGYTEIEKWCNDTKRWHIDYYNKK
jgi:hypothetical protein